MFLHCSFTTNLKLQIAFSKDGSVPDKNKVVIENKTLCNGILESIIGEHGVSPAAKRSLAIRLCEHLNLKSQSSANQEEVKEEHPVIINASLVE
jgi:chalcone isomerase